MISSHYLNSLFNPRSVAVIGVSNKENSIGAQVFANLIQANYEGRLYPVNPNYNLIQNIPCVASVKNIDDEVDLAIIVAPAIKVPDIIAECGEKGIKTAVIITSGFSEAGKVGKALETQIIEISHQHKLRLVGPNCLGLMRPAIGLNATFDNVFPKAGKIALISQSGAICAAVIDWAVEKDIGFSTILSTGNAADIDFGEILDFLAHDPLTESILLYIEGVHNARAFVSGLRAASRVKPVIAIKAGRNPEGSRAVHSHTGVLVGDDDVFEEVLRRAGVIRVKTIEQLFQAAQVLSCQRHAKGKRLTIVTNGGGAGVLAADHATELKIDIPSLSESILSELDTTLPQQWSHQNPMDILGDATPERYAAVIRSALEDKNSDGLLVILVPVPISQPDKTAEQLTLLAKHTDKPVIGCWMGEQSVKLSRRTFSENNIPCFSTPESAVEAFAYLANHYYNQQLLLQVPEPHTYQFNHDITGARLIIDTALSQNRTLLTAIESKTFLKAFGISINATIEAKTDNDAMIAAESLGFPVALKISSPDITHKQDVGGVLLNIADAEQVRSSFNKIIANAKYYCPNANIKGVTIEKMYKTPHDRELMIGVIQDKIFGPVISFGMGGSLVEIIRDRAIALPPINRFIAKHLINATRAAKWLAEFRGMPAANLEMIIDVLLRISDLICEFPQIKELDINPLVVNEMEAIVIDARIVIAPQPKSFKPYSHLAIAPYPSYLISHFQLSDGIDVTIRPIRPEDALSEQEFIGCLLPETTYQRFMGHLTQLTPEMLMGITQIDYDRDMTLIAVCHDIKDEIIGLAQYYLNPDRESCEVGLVIADKWQGRGIGTKLLSSLIEITKERGIRTMKGVVQTNNKIMLELLHEFGFIISKNVDNSLSQVTKLLI
ncbi:GNAT family N-acetyltransferase [soil metagenome]